MCFALIIIIYIFISTLLQEAQGSVHHLLSNAIQLFKSCNKDNFVVT